MSVYKTTVINNGGREGISKVEDSKLEFQLVNVLDGKQQPENTTNPEHLFAAAIASCFGGAFLYHMEEAGKESEVTTTVTLSLEPDEEDGENRLRAVIEVDAPGLSEEEKKDLLDKSAKFSPYTKIFEGKADLEVN